MTLYAFQLGPIETPQGPDLVHAGMVGGQLLLAGSEPGPALLELKESAGPCALTCAPELAGLGGELGYRVAPEPPEVQTLRAELEKILSRTEPAPGVLASLARRRVTAPIRAFPDPHDALPNGLLAFGGDLAPEGLVLAYGSGIFPWPTQGMIPWFSLPQRAILELSRLHVGRSLARAERQSPLRFTVDADFGAVLHACSETPRPGQSGSWISPEVRHAYLELHHRGYAHSVEAWHGERLVGGVFGISVRGTFGAESMFHTESNASKLALLFLMRHLQARGLDWIDVQVLSPVVEQLGAQLVPRDVFLARLAETQARGLRPFDPGGPSQEG
jgi:leucyl/phenylalanyl-tRNA--protein transferase